MSLTTDRIMSDARIRLPGALDDVLLVELYRTLDEFFRRSDAWQETVSFVSLDGYTDYDVESEEFRASIVHFIGVTNADKIPIAASMPAIGTVRLVTMPTVGLSFLATFSLTVQDPVLSTGFPDLPDDILTQYSTWIVDGLVSRMMSQPAKPYSNPTMAMFHGQRFTSAISTARANAWHENISAGQRWRFPQTFATVR